MFAQIRGEHLISFFIFVVVQTHSARARVKRQTSPENMISFPRRSAHIDMILTGEIEQMRCPPHSDLIDVDIMLRVSSVFPSEERTATIVRFITRKYRYIYIYNRYCSSGVDLKRREKKKQVKLGSYSRRAASIDFLDEEQ